MGESRTDKLQIITQHYKHKPNPVPYFFFGRGEFRNMTFFLNTMLLDYPDVSDLACNREVLFFLGGRKE